MRKGLATFVIVVAGALLGSAGATHAGGWAVVAMDPLAQPPIESQPLSVGFTILQHGVTPYTTANAFIIVTDATGRTERFAARPDGEPGHHISQVTFAAAGVYRWEVQPDWFAKQPLGEVTVTSSPRTSPSNEVATTMSTTTTTTVREPIGLALRIMLAVALTLALGVVIAELATARRRATT